MRTIRRVAVLGAGTMGSRIAAHFANAGVPALLLDVVLPDEEKRNAAALRGIERAASQKPGAFFTPDTAALVSPGNFDDDLGAIADCDWIIEAVSENLAVKRALIEKAALWRRPDSIFSTNTSGIPVAQIVEGFSPEFGRSFLGTHFFNPPRYLHLLEVVPGPDTDPEVLEFVSNFAGLRLGKGVVRAKDTPNFIANRIGTFLSATVLRLMVEGHYSVEEVDALTGPLIGFPKSASLRLSDIIGLDTRAYVAQNLSDHLAPGDPWRERFHTPDFLARMIERGWLGEKSGQGFYKRVGSQREIQAIDWKTLDYHPAEKPSFPSVDATRHMRDLPERLRAVVSADDRAGAFLWRAFSDLFLYTAGLVPEITDRIVEIDRAMRWGYAHRLGPFELWDALGVEETVERMRGDRRMIPANVEAMLASGARSFYRPADRYREPHTEYFDLERARFETVEDRPCILVLSDLRRARGVVSRNAGASLIDLGDGALCLEFHQRRNVLGEDQIEMILAGIEETSRNFEAMVIASQGEAFSAGADLTLILMAAQEHEWDDLDAAVRRFQNANMAIKYAARPVVAAPFGFMIGGGCEVALHAARMQASAELYMGLVEVGAGLIPAGGGCKEMLIRLGSPQRVMDLIRFAKVSSSAADARQLGFLKAPDAVSMNPERLIADAKAAALALAPSWAPGIPRSDVRVSGDAGYAAMQIGAWLSHTGHYISGYDLKIAGKLAYILSGGRLSGAQNVSEQYLLDLEREAFLSLCGEQKTQERIEHMLATGKPLRN